MAMMIHTFDLHTWCRFVFSVCFIRMWFYAQFSIYYLGTWHVSPLRPSRILDLIMCVVSVVTVVTPWFYCRYLKLLYNVLEIFPINFNRTGPDRPARHHSNKNNYYFWIDYPVPPLQSLFPFEQTMIYNAWKCCPIKCFKSTSQLDEIWYLSFCVSRITHNTSNYFISSLFLTCLGLRFWNRFCVQNWLYTFHCTKANTFWCAWMWA